MTHPYKLKAVLPYIPSSRSVFPINGLADFILKNNESADSIRDNADVSGFIWQCISGPYPQLSLRKRNHPQSSGRLRSLLAMYR